MLVSCKSSRTSLTPHLWPKSYRMVRCLVQRSHWTLLLWGWRRKSHHIHIAINEFLSPNLAPNNGTLWFQQDCATAHTAVISIAALRRLFPQRVISRFGDVPWPPRSPDLTAPDFFLWVIWKVKCTVIALQTYIHSNKTYGKKLPNFQKKHFKPLCAAS